MTDAEIEEVRTRMMRAVPPGSRVFLHDSRIVVIEPHIHRLLEEAIRLRRELHGLGTSIEVLVLDEERARVRAAIRGTKLDRALREGELLVRT